MLESKAASLDDERKLMADSAIKFDKARQELEVCSAYSAAYSFFYGKKLFVFGRALLARFCCVVVSFRALRCLSCSCVFVVVVHFVPCIIAIRGYLSKSAKFICDSADSRPQISILFACCAFDRFGVLPSNCHSDSYV